MKLSMHEHFVLLAIAILFEFNKVASSRRRSRSNVKCADNIFNTGNVNCGGHIAKTCSLCPCTQQGTYGSDWCNGECQWSGGACYPHNKCAGVIFNTGKVNCGGHYAKTCSQCPCSQRGVYMGLVLNGGINYTQYCNGDCQWRGDHLSGVCRMKQKIKGEWHLRETTIQGMLWLSWTGQC